jgi:Fe-S-cluster-containing dehydrogenase component/formate-dependent nitrite reductase membrane component NrfD
LKTPSKIFDPSRADMPNLGFVIDNRKCIGCHACTVACKSEHQVPLGVDRTWVKYVEKGTFPDSRRFFTVMRCNHCENAPCVTICPVTALYTRADGAVDFNSDRCIGCKACLQACPYDALYIDPDTSTAAKCNFCTHRLEIGLEPSCVVVCPERAIIAGDLADPASEISQLIARHPVQVRKPEKGTRPKLFYINADEASLVPSQTSAGGPGMWSGADGPARQALEFAKSGPAAKRAYDVPPRATAWGWEVVGYTWTKSIAAGSFMAIVAARLTEASAAYLYDALHLGVVALLFLAVTAGLLVADLKRPRRFLYVLLRPQWKSWLVRGAYVLTVYGAALSFWLFAEWAGARRIGDFLLWPGTMLAALAAMYTAFLFAQAKGRDFWQSPVLGVHLLAQAMVAGGSVWLLVRALGRGDDVSGPAWFTAAGLLFSLGAIFTELASPSVTVDGHRALQWIIGQHMGRWFWTGGIGLGHLVPLAILPIGGAGVQAIAALLALGGLVIIEALWVIAPQRIPLS